MMWDATRVGSIVNTKRRLVGGNYSPSSTPDRLSPSAHPARYQSNLMHELTHILLNHPMVGFDPQTGLPMREPHYEDEAIYLGSCLQIPRLGLQWASQKGYTRQEIAEYFGASEEMVRFRCNMIGITVTEKTHSKMTPH